MGYKEGSVGCLVIFYYVFSVVLVDLLNVNEIIALKLWT